MVREEVRLTQYCRAPDWYREEWFRHLREELDWSEEKIFSWVRKEERRSGICLEVPPPSPSSGRWVGCEVCGDHVVIMDLDQVSPGPGGGWCHTECQ